MDGRHGSQPGCDLAVHIFGYTWLPNVINRTTTHSWRAAQGGSADASLHRLGQNPCARQSPRASLTSRKQLLQRVFQYSHVQDAVSTFDVTTHATIELMGSASSRTPSQQNERARPVQDTSTASTQAIAWTRRASGLRPLDGSRMNVMACIPETLAFPLQRKRRQETNGLLDQWIAQAEMNLQNIAHQQRHLVPGSHCGTWNGFQC